VSASKKARRAGDRQQAIGKRSSRRPSPIAHRLSPSPKPLNEVWWCAISPYGAGAIWTYLDLTKANVAELLTKKLGNYWEANGWRIAKLQVTEI